MRLHATIRNPIDKGGYVNSPFEPGAKKKKHTLYVDGYHKW